MARLQDDPQFLFRLIVKLSGGTAIITAWESYERQYSSSHTKLDAELRWKPAGSRSKSLLIFERGNTWCGVPGHTTLDGNAAKELVMSLFAMKPGDTDAEYFATYSTFQMEWARENGEELSIEAEGRYGSR
jgi:hypothetical protein